LDFDVVCSNGDDGNWFGLVYLPPSFGFFDKREHSFDDTEDCQEKPNAVCIN